MVPEAPLEKTEHGLRVSGEGWFVVNARDLRWFESELGLYTMFDSEEARFDQVGINIGILRPGEPNCMYHAEGAQEDFLVLSGECLFIVEGQERLLKAWDFVHCPAWTEHVFVGAGDGAVRRGWDRSARKGPRLRYAVNETALAHGAGVEEETSDPKVAYARFAEDRPIRCPEEFPG